MISQILNPNESIYNNKTIDGSNEKELLIKPNSEITITIKVSKLTLLRMWFETVNLEIAENENQIEI